jgi:hypothetical protein
MVKGDLTRLHGRMIALGPAGDVPLEFGTEGTVCVLKRSDDWVS